MAVFIICALFAIYLSGMGGSPAYACAVAEDPYGDPFNQVTVIFK